MGNKERIPFDDGGHRFLRRTAGYTRTDRKRNTDIREEPGVRSVNGIIREYRRKLQDTQKDVELRDDRKKIDMTSTKGIGRPKLKVVTGLELHACSKKKIRGSFDGTWHNAKLAQIPRDPIYDSAILYSNMTTQSDLSISVYSTVRENKSLEQWKNYRNQ
ncbi:hypothetical protein Trydic_g12186 [Trypoxylus dichotomus]